MKLSFSPRRWLLARAATTPKQSRLPGEPRPFRPLVPPQHLEGGRIVSSRSQEVSIRTDPLLDRLRQLEAENAALRERIHQLETQRENNYHL